jgi:putative DNA primase/helicase
MDFKTVVREIKTRISCLEYAQTCGLPITKSGDRCVSPLRSGATNKTSFIVYDDFFFDFGSGEGGDVVDLAAQLNFNGNKYNAIKALAKQTGVEVEQQPSESWVKYTQNLCNEIQYYHEKLTDDDRQYLYKRGIKDETINRIKIGRTNDGRLCFPYWKNGYISYYATREMPGCKNPGKYKKMKTDEFNEHTIWGLHTLNRHDKRELLIIAEGAFDALSFEQEGYSVISAITGFFSKEQQPAAIAIAKSFKKVFVVFDNDLKTKAGEKFAFKAAKILTENRIPCVVGSVPANYKDISDFYADGGNLSVIIDTAIGGVNFLASKMTDENEFESFARRVCRYMSKPNIDMFFKSVGQHTQFDPDWLKSLCKDCKAAPLDKTIAEEITTKHKLLYNERISFFQYNGTYWNSKTDTEISSYIADALGPYATGPKIASILKVIKSEVVTNKLFNVNPVINFINGTLEIEPEIKFREHRAEDCCTYCLDYPYNPSANSQQWLDFLDTVTNHDDKKICLLQELSGYVLFPDNRLQKCAVLIGSGANGKSVFLNVLTKIFGSANVSNVEMSSLSQDFQVIQLMNSMLNISAETRTNVAGAESKFKQITAGDEISACYKGKDYITFRPRAKMFLACNEYVKSSDTTEGWTRRFCFVDFPMHFVDIPNPNNPEELPIDRDIESRLTTNESLSAIFNWVLQGYEMLKACGYFTEPDDQKAINEEFKELSNPLIEFAKEVEIDGEVSNAKLYNLYKDWCEDSGHNSLARNTFVKRVAKAFKEYRPELEQYKYKNERGWQPKFTPCNDEGNPFL